MGSELISSTSSSAWSWRSGACFDDGSLRRLALRVTTASAALSARALSSIARVARTLFLMKVGMGNSPLDYSADRRKFVSTSNLRKYKTEPWVRCLRRVWRNHMAGSALGLRSSLCFALARYHIVSAVRLTDHLAGCSSTPACG